MQLSYKTDVADTDWWEQADLWKPVDADESTHSPYTQHKGEKKIYHQML